MIFLSFFLLYSLTLITATHNTTGGPSKEESKMNTMVIVGLAGGSILIVVVVLLVIFLVILPWRRKKKAYKRREAQVLEVLPKLKLTRTIEEPEVHSVERITQWSDREKAPAKNEDKNSKQLGIPPMAKTSKESTEASKEKTAATPGKEGKASKESTKSNKESANGNMDPNKEKSIEKEKSVDTLDFVDSPK